LLTAVYELLAQIKEYVVGKPKITGKDEFKGGGRK
jgi:hypothetical protein